MATMVHVDHASSITADRITCSRYRNTNGFDVPPDRYSWAVRLATSTSIDKNSSPLVTAHFSCQRNWLATLKAIRQASTSSMYASGSWMPRPPATTAMVEICPTTAIQRSWISCCMFWWPAAWPSAVTAAGSFNTEKMSVVPDMGRAAGF
jgi:hypothetical protein